MRVAARCGCIVMAVIGLSLQMAHAVTLGQTDTFQDGTTQGWQEGAVSPNPPTNVSSGGPGGAGDAYLQNISSGGSGPGAKMTMFNSQQWSGDYNAVGLSGIEMDVVNLGNTDLNVRVVLFQPALSNAWASTVAISLPAGGGWQHASFDLTAAGLSQVEGAASLDTVRSNVQQLRVVSAAALNTDGDPIAGTIGIDNVHAIPEPGSLGILILLPLLARRRDGR